MAEVRKKSKNGVKSVVVVAEKPSKPDIILRPHIIIENPRLLLPRHLIAKAFGVSMDMVGKWDVKPVIKRGPEALYYLPEVVNHRQGNDDSLKLNPAQEKARLDQVRRERTQIQLEKERGNIVDIADVCKELEKELIAVRQKLLSIPNKLATTLVPMDKPQEIQDAIYNAICDALKDLNYGERIPIANQADHSGNAQAAAAIKSS